MSFTCCYCKNVFEGTNNFEIPEGFPHDVRLEGLPLCDGCGGGPEPTLDTICGVLDEEMREHDRAITEQIVRRGASDTEIEGMADNTVTFIDYLKSLPTDDDRLDVLDMIYEKICKDCGRLLGEDDKCYCEMDE